MQNFKKVLLLALVLFFANLGIIKADSPVVNLTIRDGDTIVFSDSVPLQTAGIISLNDTGGNSHPLEATSVLSVLNDADILSSNFEITDLQYYDSYGSFYLKCINSKCDNWQYVVDDTTPGIGMDKKILSGGESIYLYFSAQHQITLSANTLTNEDTLTVSAKNYVYQDNTWEPLTGVNIGLTQPNEQDPFSPTEITVNPVDASGQATFTSIVPGTYNVGIKEDFYFPTESLTITEAVHSSSGGGSSKIKPVVEIEKIKPAFDIDKAFEFLISQQKEDGSFGNELYTDWATMSLISTDKYQDAKIKLIKYYTSQKTKGEMLTDSERYTMAIMSLGLNPYNINGENQIEKITKEFDGTQFGDKEIDNDDIFALIVLQNAGFKENEEMIQKTIDFILSKQKENGSWDNSPDMTGAAMQAITAFAGENFLLRGVSQADEPRGSAGVATPDSDPGKEEFFSVKIPNALIRAKEFLKQNQKDDGGFGNVSSTAWAIQGILSLGEKPEDWKINNPADDKASTPLDYLATNQDTDGGMKNLPAEESENMESKIWETAYVLSALSEKTWIEIMQKFEAPLVASDEVKTVIVNPEIKLVKSEIQKINKIKNLEKLSNELTASPINAIPSTEENIPEVKKENWFKRFINRIFGL